jgi:histidinol-phosphate aminotransferase
MDLARSAGAPSGPELYDALLRQGVIVRPMGPFGLPGHLRVSVGAEVENRRLLDALARVGRG